MREPCSTDELTALQINLVERVCVGDIITRTSELYPHALAVIDGVRRITYAELDEQATRLGHSLLGLGLQPLDVVAVMARNCAELLVTYFACARAGLVCAPVNLGLRPSEIAWCVRDARARVLILERALGAQSDGVLAASLPDGLHRFWIAQAEKKETDNFEALVDQGSVAPLEVMVRDRDPVQLLYTSGTTAHPKGVLTSHLAVTMAALSNAITHKCTPGFTALIGLPLFHCAMLNSIVMPLILMGGRAVLTAGFDVHRDAELIDAEGVNMTVLLPVMYGQLLNDPEVGHRQFPSMQRAIYAMAQMPGERLQAIHHMFPNADVVLGSGQTEFTPATCMQRAEDQWSKAATWGTATPMTRVAIMDDDGHLLPRGETGELVYRGPQVMNGYLNQPESSRQSFRHGWFHSGDVAHIDEDGAIWFKDRYKDVIKTGGENVASMEVERCLLEHPDVADAVAVGAPHERWGEAITGVVITRAGALLDETQLLQHCRERLAGFKVPKRVVFVAEFPRTGTGKVQKHVLRTHLHDLYSQ